VCAPRKKVKVWTSKYKFDLANCPLLCFNAGINVVVLYVNNFLRTWLCTAYSLITKLMLYYTVVCYSEKRNCSVAAKGHSAGRETAVAAILRCHDVILHPERKTTVGAYSPNATCSIGCGFVVDCCGFVEFSTTNRNNWSLSLCRVSSRSSATAEIARNA